MQRVIYSGHGSWSQPPLCHEQHMFFDFLLAEKYAARTLYLCIRILNDSISQAQSTERSAWECLLAMFFIFILHYVNPVVCHVYSLPTSSAYQLPNLAIPELYLSNRCSSHKHLSLSTSACLSATHHSSKRNHLTLSFAEFHLLLTLSCLPLSAVTPVCALISHLCPCFLVLGSFSVSKSRESASRVLATKEKTRPTANRRYCGLPLPLMLCRYVVENSIWHAHVQQELFSAEFYLLDACCCRRVRKSCFVV